VGAGQAVRARAEARVITSSFRCLLFMGVSFQNQGGSMKLKGFTVPGR
jgi:hypothetical protein